MAPTVALRLGADLVAAEQAALTYLATLSESYTDVQSLPPATFPLGGVLLTFTWGCGLGCGLGCGFGLGLLTFKVAMKSTLNFSNF